jgi:rhodanese-related sulfurtransferase
MPTRSALTRILLKSLIIIFLGSAMGLLYNVFSPGGITLKGSWSNKITSDSVVVPYSYNEGSDPPAISLDYAQMKFQSAKTIFLDARLPVDFKAGHIQGAMNLPYEEFDQYTSSVLPKIPTTGEIITYCDGTECEASLLLARELQDLGYRNIKIFFGGWAEWQQAGLATKTGE